MSALDYRVNSNNGADVIVEKDNKPASEDRMKEYIKLATKEKEGK